MHLGGGRFVFVMLAVLVSLTSCGRHFYDVGWKCVVVDAQTGLPVPGCKVNLACYYQNNMDYSEVVNYQANTSVNGMFELQLERGYRVAGQIDVYGYEPLRFSLPLLPGNLPRVMSLSRTEVSDLSLIDVRLAGFTSNAMSPFMGVKYIEGDSASLTQVGIVGFDLINGRMTPHTDSADVWVELSEMPVRAKRLVSHLDGGLLVVGNQTGNNIFPQMPVYAPSDGYVSFFDLDTQGNEFFVKCRDRRHFAKISLDNQLCIMRYSNRNGSYCDLGVCFSYMIQRDLLQPRFLPLPIGHADSLSFVVFNREDRADSLKTIVLK